MLNHGPTLGTLAVFLALVGALPAQPTPPAQSYVAAVGKSPLKAPLTSDFDAGSSFTMEGWIFLPVAGPGSWIMGKDLDALGVDPYLGFALMLDGSGNVMFASSTGAAGTFRSVSSPAALPLRTWTHVAAVMNGGTMQLLINGAVVATGSSLGAPPAEAAVPFSIGSAFLSNGSPNYPAFSGYARQIRFWNVPRTPAQIVAALGESLPADRTGLVADWPLDESSGQTARDLSGANRPLTGFASARTAVVDAGPFFAATITTRSDEASRYPSQGALVDFDGDGHLDVVMQQMHYTQASATPAGFRAFRNSNGTFVDVTDTVLGNVTLVHPRMTVVGDFNGDGRTDLLAVGHGYDFPPYPGEQSRLLIQTTDGRLAEDPARLPSGTRFTHNVSVADIDHDGDLDIYMCNVATGALGPRLFLNDGHGYFTEDTTRLPPELVNGSLGTFTASLLVDVNRDGYPDLVLGSLQGPTPGQGNSNQLFINDGTGHFVRDSRFALPAKLLDPAATVVNIESADFNGDGWPDLVLATDTSLTIPPDGQHVSARIQLLLNNGDGTFRDVSDTSGIVLSPTDVWTEWIHPVDLNGDGRPDLVMKVNTGSGPVTRLFLNRGTDQGRFCEASEAYDINTHAAIVLPGDVDGNGHVAIVSISGDTIALARSLKPIDPGLFQAPGIVVQPHAVFVAAGQSTALSVTAAGAFNPTYQWKRNGVDISGATASTLTIPNVQSANIGSYSVVVTSPAGSTVSDTSSVGLMVAPSNAVITITVE